MDNYIINKNTMVLIPISKNETKILEVKKEITVSKNIQKIIEDSCLYFFSSYIGRLKSTNNLIGINYKAPIIIEEKNKVIFFPLTSPKYNNSIWISLNNIKEYYKKDNNTFILLINNQILELNISYFSLSEQIKKSYKLFSILKNRKLS